MALVQFCVFIIVRFSHLCCFNKTKLNNFAKLLPPAALSAPIDSKLCIQTCRNSWKFSIISHVWGKRRHVFTLSDDVTFFLKDLFFNQVTNSYNNEQKDDGILWKERDRPWGVARRSEHSSVLFVQARKNGLRRGNTLYKQLLISPYSSGKLWEEMEPLLIVNTSSFAHSCPTVRVQSWLVFRLLLDWPLWVLVPIEPVVHRCQFSVTYGLAYQHTG